MFDEILSSSMGELTHVQSLDFGRTIHSSHTTKESSWAREVESHGEANKEDQETHVLVSPCLVSKTN